MSKYEWKEQTTAQKILYVISMLFTYGGTISIGLYAFVIENLVKEQNTIAKIGCSGITCLAIIFLIIVAGLNKYINRNLEHNNERQQQLIKDMLTTTDADKLEQLRSEMTELENYAVRVKAVRNIYKNGIVVGLFIGATIMLYLVEKSIISIRGIFFGMTMCVFVGFLFNIAYQNLTRKIKTK